MDTEISVVIATLGGSSVENTIGNLLSSSLIPREILICIPEDHAHKVSHLSSDIVKIIATQVKGQVKQRAYGFTQTNYPLVLQSDDDMLFENDSLQKMADYLVDLGRGNAIGPIYYGPNTKRCNHELQNGLLKNIFDCIIGGAPWGKKKMGTVSSIGLNYGVDDRFTTTDLLQTDWLPGACALCFREDLITTDYFPFTGKAYLEDIFNSFYRRVAGVRMWIATRVLVYTDEPVSRLGRDTVQKEIPIRRYYVKLSKGPLWRLSVYEIFTRIRSLFNT